jgi:hypothetical protein
MSSASPGRVWTAMLGAALGLTAGGHSMAAAARLENLSCTCKAYIPSEPWRIRRASIPCTIGVQAPVEAFGGRWHLPQPPGVGWASNDFNFVVVGAGRYNPRALYPDLQKYGGRDEGIRAGMWRPISLDVRNPNLRAYYVGPFGKEATGQDSREVYILDKRARGLLVCFLVVGKPDPARAYPCSGAFWSGSGRLVYSMTFSSKLLPSYELFRRQASELIQHFAESCAWKDGI